MDQQGHQEERGWAAADEDAPFVRVPKTAELVADQLREQIVSGALVAGDHLPPETVLTEAFGIARPTLREAMRILESEGLIAIARGARTGARVLRPSLDPLVRQTTMLLRVHAVDPADIAAARLAIENVAIAAVRRIRDEAALDALRAALAGATGNDTLAMFAAVLARVPLTAPPLDDPEALCRPLLMCLETGDAAAAEAHWHLALGTTKPTGAV